MSLLNVRLTKADEEALRILKRSRVEISAIVRAAIRQEAEKHRSRSVEFTSSLLTEIFEKYPEPVRAKSRDYDVHDRRSFAEAFRAHLRTRRRRRK